jgi:hypothetical protein
MTQLERIEKKLDWIHWALTRIDYEGYLQPQLVGFASHRAIMEKNLPVWPGDKL